MSLLKTTKKKKENNKPEDSTKGREDEKVQRKGRIKGAMKEDRKAVNGISFLCRITFHPVHVLSIICT